MEISRACPVDVCFRRETIKYCLEYQPGHQGMRRGPNGAEYWTDSICTSFWCGQGVCQCEEVMRAPCGSPCSCSLAASVSARRWDGLRGRTGERSAPRGHCL